ncbi:extracellular solute-binding protein [Paenibacillus sp. CMAA1364]
MKQYFYRVRPIRIAIIFALMSCILSACIDTSHEPFVTPVEQRALIRFVASEYSTETRPLLEKLVKEFGRRNPLIDIELQVVNWDILDGIYTTMISKNQPPDLLNTNVYAHFAQDGLLNNLDEIISPELASKLDPHLVEMDQMNGVQYAIPYVATTRNLYYNKELFRKAGILTPPSTWSELVDAARKLRSIGVSEAFGMDLSDNETQASLSYAFFGAGGSWTEGNEWKINAPNNIEGLTFLKKLYDEGLTDSEPTITTRDEKHRILGEGRLAMMISGNYFTSVVPREFPALEWGKGPIPVKDGLPPMTFGVQDVLVSFKTDHTNKEALSKFLDFLYDDQTYEQMIRREGFLPVTKTVGNTLGEQDKHMKEDLEALGKAKFYPLQQPSWQAVLDYTRKLGDAVLFEGFTPQSALDQLQHFAESKSHP